MFFFNKISSIFVFESILASVYTFCMYSYSTKVVFAIYEFVFDILFNKNFTTVFFILLFL